MIRLESLQFVTRECLDTRTTPSGGSLASRVAEEVGNKTVKTLASENNLKLRLRGLK
jgi:hypothetical protein